MDRRRFRISFEMTDGTEAYTKYHRLLHEMGQHAMKLVIEPIGFTHLDGSVFPCDNPPSGFKMLIRGADATNPIALYYAIPQRSGYTKNDLIQGIVSLPAGSMRWAPDSTGNAGWERV